MRIEFPRWRGIRYSLWGSSVVSLVISEILSLFNLIPRKVTAGSLPLCALLQLPSRKKKSQNERDTSLEVSEVCRKDPESLADKKANLPQEFVARGRKRDFVMPCGELPLRP